MILSAAIELVIGVASITVAGLLLLHAWDQQNAEIRARRRSRKS
jgi:hypothetical protein